MPQLDLDGNPISFRKDINKAKVKEIIATGKAVNVNIYRGQKVVRPLKSFIVAGIVFYFTHNSGNYLTTRLIYKDIKKKKRKIASKKVVKKRVARLYKVLCKIGGNQCSFCEGGKLTKSVTLLAWLLRMPMLCCGCYAKRMNLDW